MDRILSQRREARKGDAKITLRILCESCAFARELLR